MKTQRSAGGMIYIYNTVGEPCFLLLKRYTMSKTIERVAPKGKIQSGETKHDAALREIYEEVGLHPKNMKVQGEVGDLRLELTAPGGFERKKKISFFLVQYLGSKHDIVVQDSEGFLGYYKRATINELLGLIHYENLRELFRKAYQMTLTK